jgi:hypothetical protein
MNISNLIQKENVLLCVTPAQLEEFALSVAEKAKAQGSDPEQLYTPTEFAKRHHVTASTLWRWCKAGVLKRTIIGGTVFYKDSNLKIEEG